MFHSPMQRISVTKIRDVIICVLDSLEYQFLIVAFQVSNNQESQVGAAVSFMIAN